MLRRSAAWLLAGGVLLFAFLVGRHGAGSLDSLLSALRSGLLPLLVLFHLLPLVLDAAAMQVLLPGGATHRHWRACVLARWVGESASSLLPFGQLAGPVVVARYLAGRALPEDEAMAAVTVSTTLQALAQILFALAGLAVLGTHAISPQLNALRPAIYASSILLACLAAAFYVVQRRGLFAAAVRGIARLTGRQYGAGLLRRAAAIDAAIERTYGQGRRAPACLLLNFLGWLAGTGETWLALRLMHAPVDWPTALLLESIGQAIRGAAFAIPGALGVQEGGYLLLAPVAGLAPGIAIALSLAKRARELVMAAPGLVHLYLSDRRFVARRDRAGTLDRNGTGKP